MGASLEDRFATAGGPGGAIDRAIPDINDAADDKVDTTNPPTLTSGLAWEDVSVEHRPRDRSFTQTLGGEERSFATVRLLDVLYSTPAVGAWMYPRVTGDDDLRWTTLGESLAIALDYNRDTADEPVMGNLGELALLDRGDLVLDDFVPFIDLDGPDGLLTPGTDDTPVGLGVPIALALGDHFTMSDQPTLTTPVQGLINVNTAPHMVLRQVPMFAPTPVSSTGIGTSYDEWWWGGTQHTADADVGAGVIAYRDRSSAHALLPPQGTSTLDFFDIANNDPTVSTYREYTTGVQGLRDGEGFRTLGELLMVREVPGFVDSGATAFAFSMDRLARDGEQVGSGSPGVDVALAVEGSAYGPDAASLDRDSLADDRDERLAILSTAAQSLTVRSDYFAVWFIIRGYAESDVNVGGNDKTPMIPTVNRRYLMIVDRSSVTEPGQKPRVLAFEEVPVVGTFGSIAP